MLTKAMLKTAEWQALTEKERVWVAEYVNNGFDKLSATSAAFDTTTDKSTAALAGKMLRKPRIVSMLQRLGLGQTISMEEFWLHLRGTIRQNENMAAKNSALKLAAELMGWSRKPVEDETEEELPPELAKLLEEDEDGVQDTGRVPVDSPDASGGASAAE